jgi:hypothetical protein
MVIISVRGLVDPRAVVRLEGLVNEKSLRYHRENEPATYRLVELCLDQMRQRVPHTL